MKKEQLPPRKDDHVQPFHPLDDFDSQVDPSLDIPPAPIATLVVSALLLALITALLYVL